VAVRRFKTGDRVRVLPAARSGYTRTPGYVRGKTGWVERVYGEVSNWETSAHGQGGLPKRTLYLVGFQQAEVWDQYNGSPRDKLYVDLLEHWLEPT
jgi:hypothetical protein